MRNIRHIPKGMNLQSSLVNKLTSYSCTLYLNNIMSKNFIWIPNILQFNPQAEDLNLKYPIKCDANNNQLPMNSNQWLS